MRFISLLAAAALLAAPAGAIDLTGTWVGGTKCSVYNGERNKFSSKGQILLITQVGNVLNIDWDGDPMAGIAINDLSKPDAKGAAAFVSCYTTTDPTTGYAELSTLQAKVNRPKGKGSLRGTGIYTVDGNFVATCQWKFKLTSTADPGVPATCP